MNDNVNHPEHYTQHPSGVECIQITEHMGFCVGNAIKYLWRHEQKGGVEDLKKARWYIDREIGRQENVNETDFVKNQEGPDTLDDDQPSLADLVDWNEAPEWAEWAAQEKHGTIYWFMGPDKPYLKHEKWYGGGIRVVAYKEVALFAHDWRTPLKRPANHTYTDEEPEHRIRYRDSAAPSDVPYSEIPVTEQEDEGFEVLSVRRDKRN